MAATLRKSIALHIRGQEIAVDVDFRLLEIIERTFGRSLDQIVVENADPSQFQRRHAAQIVVDWLELFRGDLFTGESKWARIDVREFVLTMPPDAYVFLVAAILAAVLYARKEMTAEEFEKAKGELAEAQSGKKKAPAPAAPETPATPSSPPATT
jgi:hypothetical protein